MSTIEDFYRRNYDLHREAIKKAPFGTDPTASISSIPESERYYPVYKFLQERRPDSILELGFGSDQYLDAFSTFCSVYHIVDIVDRRSSSTLSTKIRFFQHDLNADFLFHEGTYDFVVALMVIEHLFDPFHSFREVHRVLKPGGYALINLPLVTSWKNRLRLLFGKMPVTSRHDWYTIGEWDGGHLHYFDLSSVARLAHDSGFTLVERYAVGKGVFLKNWFPGIFCAEISLLLKKR
jgi:SAM-dependent methyltransferase